MKGEKFKVGCGLLTSRIFVGKVIANGTWGKVKHDVTDSAVGAVAIHLLQKGEKMQFNHHGKTYQIKVEEEDLELWQPIETAPKDGSLFIACTGEPYGTTRLVKFASPDDRLPSHGEGVLWPTPPKYFMPLPLPPKPPIKL